MNDFELSFLEFEHTKRKEQVCFYFICSFFTCFVISLCINALRLFVLSTVCKHTGWVCSPFDYCFAITLCNTLSTFCILTGSLKQTPLARQLSQWSQNFLKIWLSSAEIRMSKLSKVGYQNKLPLLQCFTLDKFLFSAG